VKRVLIVLLVAATGVLAWSLPTPPQETSSSITTSTTGAAVSTSSHSTCPWAYSDDSVDTFLVAQSAEPAQLRFTFPVSGEVEATINEEQLGSSATALSLASVLNRGLDPAVVEFSSSPSAAGIVETGAGILALDVCPSASSKIWHLPGGSTLDGQSLQLVLFNPFSEDARAAVSVRSEVGIEPVAELDSVTVTGRSWKVIDFARLLPLRQSMSITIDMKQGVVTPEMVYSEGTDVAVWTNQGQADQWDFPIVDTGGLEPSLALSNDAAGPVDYEIDTYTSAGAVVASLTGTVDAASHVDLPLGDLAEAPFGVRVRTGGPVAATVIADDGSRVAATTGVAAQATHWMLPGFGLVGTNTLWVMNSGTETATVTYRLVDSGGALGDADKVAVPPGTIRSVRGLPIGASGLEVESNVPVSISWSAETAGAVGFEDGVPLP
jgi:hypothetical protein